MRFHEKLRKLCDERGIGPTDLYRAVGGASRSTFHNWANGVSPPNLDVALGIARYFGVSLEYLADDAIDEPPAPAVSADEWDVIRLMRDLGLDRVAATRGLAAAVRPATPATRTEATAGSAIRETRAVGGGKERAG